MDQALVARAGEVRLAMLGSHATIIAEQAKLVELIAESVEHELWQADGPAPEGTASWKTTARGIETLLRKMHTTYWAPTSSTKRTGVVDRHGPVCRWRESGGLLDPWRRDSATLP